MERYWRIYRTFVSTSLIRELEFKANFFAKLLQQTVWCGFFVVIILVIYGKSTDVAGWGRADSFILAATVFLITGISAAFTSSLNDIPQMVRQGTLDFVVSKPVDSQFWVSARRFNFDQVGVLLTGIAMVVSGVATNGNHPSLAQWMAYSVLVLSGSVLFYAFNLVLMTTGIWLVRVDNLFILSESVTNVARFPVDIYNLGIRWVLTYAIPLALLSTVPARQLVKGFDAGGLVLGVAWAIALLLAARFFWRFALTKYSSASS